MCCRCHDSVCFMTNYYTYENEAAAGALQGITWSDPAAHIVHEAAGYKLSC